METGFPWGSTQALTDLLVRLEEVDVTEPTEEEIAAARDEVAKNMGWQVGGDTREIRRFLSPEPSTVTS